MGKQPLRWRAVLGVGACLLTVMVGAAVKLQWVLTPKHAYIVLPAITLTEGEVQIASWSSDGAYLMVAALDPPARIEDLVGAANAAPALERAASKLLHFGIGELAKYETWFGRLTIRPSEWGRSTGLPAPAVPTSR